MEEGSHGAVLPLGLHVSLQALVSGHNNTDGVRQVDRVQLPGTQLYAPCTSCGGLGYVLHISNRIHKEN